MIYIRNLWAKTLPSIKSFVFNGLGIVSLNAMELIGPTCSPMVTLSGLLATRSVLAPEAPL
jgi:hypothetical protein